MQQGRTEQAIIDQALKAKRPIPKAIQDAPTLYQGLEVFWEAYSLLSTCRPIGFGAAGPIPWTAVAQYAEVHGLDEDQLERLEYFVPKMDEVYLAWLEEERKKNGRQLQGKNGGAGPWSGSVRGKDHPEGGSES